MINDDFDSINLAFGMGDDDSEDLMDFFPGGDSHLSMMNSVMSENNKS